MFRSSASIVPVLAFVFAAAPSAAAPVDTAAIRAHAEFLADDSLRGRDTGSPEFAIAASYAATRFASFGLKPGAGESWFQPIRFAEARVENPALSATRAGKKVDLVPVEEFILLGSLVREEVRAKADVVFVGYGIDAPELGRRDYQGIDVRGKIVLCVKGAPASFPNDQRAHYSSTRLKAETAEQHGAIGVLTIRDRDEEKRVPWERIKGYTDHPRTAWIDEGDRIQDAFPGLVVAGLLSREGATKLLDGSGLTLDSILDSAEKLSYKTRALPISIEASYVSKLSRSESSNVAAVLPGSDPALAGEYVVVSAHLDHVGIGRAEDGDTIYNGFYDNALGSSILLETARLLGAQAKAPKRSTLFLLVTGEERGLLGSDFFAHHPTVPAESIVADVNVDMPMLLTPTADLVAFGAEHSSLGPIAEAAARAHGFELVPDPMPAEVIFVRSDQYSFVRRGVPAIYLCAGTGAVGGGDAQAKASGGFLATHYHRPSDEAELGADWDSVGRFTAAELDIVNAVGDAASRPAWKAGDFFGETFGKR